MRFKFLALTVCLTLAWTLAQARSIEVDLNWPPDQRPDVKKSQGVSVVNIAPPSKDGVSNNRYTKFNVKHSGVVLNNSGRASETTLAGKIAGNPKLHGKQPAAIILNQVTTEGSLSQLLGPLEVGGESPADVIVANPGGITCDSCGFLKANRVTLTTGKPVVGPNNELVFHVASGRLSIEGKGLFAAKMPHNVPQIDLQGREVNVHAPIRADNQLNIAAGASYMYYIANRITSAPAAGAKPKFALDARGLGSMYANSIYLIGAEAGLGMKINADLVTRKIDGLRINAKGDVSFGRDATVQFAGKLEVRSESDLTIKGKVEDDALSSGVALLGAGGNATIAGRVDVGATHLKAVQALKVTKFGQVLTRQARLDAGTDLTIEPGSRIQGEQLLTLAANHDITIFGSAVTRKPTADATGSLTMMAGRDIVVPERGSITADGALSLHAKRLLGLDGIVTNNENALTLLTSGGDTLVGPASRVWAAGITKLQAGRLGIAGEVTTDNQLSVRVHHLSVKESGLLEAGLDLDVHANGRVLLAGRASAQQGRGTLKADGTLQINGLVNANGPLALAAGDELEIYGKATAQRHDIALHAERGDVRLGQLSDIRAGGKLDIVAGRDCIAEGKLVSGLDFTLRAGRHAQLGGKIKAQVGAVTVHAGTWDTATGQPGHLSITGAANVQLAGPLYLQTNGALINAGYVYSTAGATVSAGSTIENRGWLLTGEDLYVETGDRLYNTGLLTPGVGPDGKQVRPAKFTWRSYRAPTTPPSLRHLD